MNKNKDNNNRWMDLFRPVDASAELDFEEYFLLNFCGDTTFSMFCAWAEAFDYRYMKKKNALLVTGKGINGEQGFVILHHVEDGAAAITNVMEYVVSHCEKEDVKAVFEYVDESNLEAYRRTAKILGRKSVVEYSDIYSDYLYKTVEYCSISGRKNKSRRGSYNFLLSHYPQMHFVEYEDSLYPACTAIFEKWCSAHECENCYYGCEKRAFERFMEIYEKDRHGVYLAYNGDAPMAFCVWEQINPDTVCCFFHKNAEPVRGLTYWLSRNVVTRYDCTYVNLGEDMGIPGIITDKTLLRPCEKVKKYRFSII